MPVAVLDTNVIGVLTTRNQELQDRAKSYLADLRADGYAVAITDGTALELAANENAYTRQITLNSAAMHCDGLLCSDADEILKLEALDLVDHIPSLLLPLGDLQEIVESLHAQKSQAELRMRRRQKTLEVRQFKQWLDSHFKVAPNQVPPFSIFVRDCHLDFLQVYYDHHLAFLLHDRSFKTFDVIEDRLEPLWHRGKGWRIGVLNAMANVHRWATRELRKGEGSLSDAHVLVEAAYTDLFLTNDKELVGCGELINEVEPTPLIRAWPIG